MQLHGIKGEVRALSESARTAAEAAAALGVSPGQIASSIVFKLPNGRPLLVVTSGAHRVNTDLVANHLGVDKLHRADADFVKEVSGISIGGVSPFGWITNPTILIDNALKKYDEELIGRQKGGWEEPKLEGEEVYPGVKPYSNEVITRADVGNKLVELENKRNQLLGKQKEKLEKSFQYMNLPIIELEHLDNIINIQMFFNSNLTDNVKHNIMEYLKQCKVVKTISVYDIVFSKFYIEYL